MQAFLTELKRRHIYRVAAAYAVVAWVLIQLIGIVAPVFDMPGWVGRATFWFVLAGLPIALIFAWIQDSGPARETQASGNRADFVLAGALLAVAGMLAYQQFAPNYAPAVQEAGVAAALSAAASPKTAISLAVLPFVNLSSDKEQKFFSDGMTEEITTALAKVPDLRVVARTSAFEFKGKNVEIGKIGEQLHATHLIEGSVRKSGNRLRITAQLIKTDDGTHIWAEDYDRELTDIFTIQEDIARAITASLRMPLGLKPGENLVNNRNIDPDSYEKYLRARALFAQRVVRGDALAATLMAIPLLEAVVERNPSYAPAWVELSACYSLVAQNHAQNATEAVDDSRAAMIELRAKGEAAARKAAEIDPQEPGVYTMLGLFAWSRSEFAAADSFFQKSLSLNPDAQQLTVYADRLADAGRVKEALLIAERAHALDPLHPPTSGATILSRWLNGDDKGAIALATNSPRQVGAPLLTAIYASQGQFHQAANALAEIAGDPTSAAARAVQILRNNPAVVPAGSLPVLGGLRLIYPALGGWERLAASYERQFDVGYIAGRQLIPLWHPAYAAVRETERFKTLMRKVGLVDYWRAKGWPPQCHPTTGDDFACE